MNRAELEKRLLAIRDALTAAPFNPIEIAGDVSDLVVEVSTEWSSATCRELVTVDDDGTGFVVDLVRSWRVEPKYGAKGSEAGCHTLVYFRGIEHAQSFDGDLHDAITTALRGGKR